ncbi:MAG: helix-turn-helix domain-containing protein [Gammaproteobacteria bacterium]
MKAYGQFCPLAQAAQILCERWTLIIIRELIAGSTRFSEIQKGVPLMSPTLLSTRLKQLVKSGLVEPGRNKGSHEYHLTEAGRQLRPVVELLGAWGHRWARSTLDNGDLDAGLLMWDIRRSVDPSVFPEHRIVVQFEYPDAPKGGRNWWLVSENGEIDLCLHDHGYEVDILIKCSLKIMTEIWICETSFNEAVKKGNVIIMGNSVLINSLQSWLRSSPLSRLGTLNNLPAIDWMDG